MAVFATFVDKLGSDSIVFLDGRLSKHNMMRKVEQHVQTKKRVWSDNEVRYRIERGSIARSTPITKVLVAKIDRSGDNLKN